jgi:transcription termination factor NusB
MGIILISFHRRCARYSAGQHIQPNDPNNPNITDNSGLVCRGCYKNKATTRVVTVRRVAVARVQPAALQVLFEREYEEEEETDRVQDVTEEEGEEESEEEEEKEELEEETEPIQEKDESVAEESTLYSDQEQALVQVDTGVLDEGQQEPETETTPVASTAREVRLERSTVTGNTPKKNVLASYEAMAKQDNLSRAKQEVLDRRTNCTGIPFSGQRGHMCSLQTRHSVVLRRSPHELLRCRYHE